MKSVAPKDDLKLIWGVGPVLERRLHELGITKFSQIAAWSGADIAAIEPKLETIPDRIRRERWVETCRRLNAGCEESAAEAAGRHRVIRRVQYEQRRGAVTTATAPSCFLAPTYFLTVTSIFIFGWIEQRTSEIPSFGNGTVEAPPGA